MATERAPQARNLLCKPNTSSHRLARPDVLESQLPRTMPSAAVMSGICSE
jgi:hypothetical protein